jgi:phage regulator Rha-like protein
MSDPKLPPIHTIRGQRVVLDSDLAALYEVSTKVFNQTIRRNVARFPPDFLFQVTEEEFTDLRSQFVTSSAEGNRVLRSQIVTLEVDRRGRHRKYRPFAFTEHGAIMAATILRSERAVAMSIYVVRAFVRMREELMTSAVIFKRLAVIDKKLLEHDIVLQDVVEKLLPLLNPPPAPPAKELGFHTRLREP